MVTRVPSGAGRRAGLSLVELIVALVVFALALLGTAATLGYSARTLGMTTAHENTVEHVTVTLDSLARVPVPVSGEDANEHRRLQWVIDHETRPTTITLTAEYTAGRTRHTMEFRAFHLPIPSHRTSAHDRGVVATNPTTNEDTP